MSQQLLQVKLLCVEYVLCVFIIVISGSATKDHATLRALSALLATLPASEDPKFREEFDTVRYSV